MGTTPKKKKTQESVAAPTPNTVKITVKLGQTTLTGEGATTLLALQAIKRPDHIKSNGIVTVECGGQKTERFFRPQQMNRVFYSSPSLQAIHAKQLTYGLMGVKFA